MNKATKFIAAAVLLVAGYGLNMLEQRLGSANLVSAVNVQIFGTVTGEKAKAASEQLRGATTLPVSAVFNGANFSLYYLLALTALAVTLYRHTRRPPRLTPLAVQHMARAAALSPSMERTAAFRDNCVRRIIPRNLLRNPYGPETKHLNFEERVQIAIEASLSESRVIGAICFRVHSFRQIGGTEVQLPSEGNLEVLAALFRTKLRLTDCVRITGPQEIMIFISLLDIQQHLRNITARLAAAAIDGKQLPDWQVSISSGMAMYPIDGYTSSELIGSARKRLPLYGNAFQTGQEKMVPPDWQPALLTAG